MAKTYRALPSSGSPASPPTSAFLQTLLKHDDVRAGNVHTRFVEEHIGELLQGEHPTLYFAPQAAATQPRLAGARVDSKDPLAVLNHGLDGRELLRDASEPSEGGDLGGPDGTVPLPAPMQGTVVSLSVSEGEMVRVGQSILVMEAMKMEHVIKATTGGVVRALTVAKGDTVFEAHPLIFVEPSDEAGAAIEERTEIDLDLIRPDLAEVLERKAKTTDEGRPDAVARRRKTNQRTTRENIADLVDPGSFVEYGALVVAARRRTTPMKELIETTQADSLIMGLGQINADRFPDKDSRVAVVAYDYTVLAGTQGKKGHEKKDRMFKLAETWRLPLVMLAEGGGGRGSDTDAVSVGSLQLDTFHRFARLSGSVPLVGVTSGRCFAGNAVLLGCCDVVIATANSTIGMGGPAVIEGGGLGVFKPEEVGPMKVQVPNGVVDIAVEDEREAMAVARQYISYFQGPYTEWSCPDQRKLRHAVPENRLRAYDMRAVIETMADTDSVLEIRRGFGHGMITAFIRIEGRPIGVVANNPAYLAGAIDSPAADKASRFMQLCDAFDIPLLFLCDTPGNMVGPQKTALVRHCCRTYVVGANVTVPTFTVVIRKAYGLGALGMAGGSFHASIFSIAWPTGEFGGMGLKARSSSAAASELAAITDPAERLATYERYVAEMYERGKALNTASLFELDDVIDPADTRRWIVAGLKSAPPPPPHRQEGPRRYVVTPLPPGRGARRGGEHELSPSSASSGARATFPRSYLTASQISKPPARAAVELGAVALEERRVGGLEAGSGQPLAPDRHHGAADGRDVLVVREYGVTLRRDAHAGVLLGHVGEVAHLHAGDVVEIAGIVGVEADAVGHVADLARYVIGLGVEALPQARDAGGAVVAVAVAQAGDQQGLRGLEARRRERVDGGLGHQDGLDRREVAQAAAGAHGCGCRAELVAEGAGEGFVRAVAGVERHRENVGRAAGQRACRLGQAPAADVAHDRGSRGVAEAHQLEARHAGDLGDVVQPDVFGKVALDEPQGLVDGVHGAGIGPAADARLIGIAFAGRKVAVERRRPSAPVCGLKITGGTPWRGCAKGVWRW